MNQAKVLAIEEPEELIHYQDLVVEMFKQFFSDVASGRLTLEQAQEFTQSEWADDLLCFLAPKEAEFAYVQERVKKKLGELLNVK